MFNIEQLEKDYKCAKSFWRWLMNKIAKFCKYLDSDEFNNLSVEKKFIIRSRLYPMSKCEDYLLSYITDLENMIKNIKEVKHDN